MKKIGFILLGVATLIVLKMFLFKMLFLLSVIVIAGVVGWLFFKFRKKKK